jgi:hypothetical protein
MKVVRDQFGRVPNESRWKRKKLLGMGLGYGEAGKSIHVTLNKGGDWISLCKRVWVKETFNGIQTDISCKSCLKKVDWYDRETGYNIDFSNLRTKLTTPNAKELFYPG